jgi:hypothetical protein
MLMNKVVKKISISTASSKKFTTVESRPAIQIYNLQFFNLEPELEFVNLFGSPESES